MLFIDFLFRWGHVLFGVAWIGLLYYFNFIQGEYFKEATADAKSDATKKLAPRALWWFRWAAMLTFLTGLYLLASVGAGINQYITLGAVMVYFWRDLWEMLGGVGRLFTGRFTPDARRALNLIVATIPVGVVGFTARDYVEALEGVDLAEIAITSGAELVEGNPPAEAYALPDVPGVGVVFRPAEGEKCERCWKILSDVNTDRNVPGVCRRCADAVQHFQTAAD